LALPAELSKGVKAKLQKTGYDEQKKIILFNVGAAWETKRWFPEKWVELIEMMKTKEFFSLLLWGNEEEKSLATAVHEKTQVPLAPFLSLKEVMALVKESSLLVSGDTFSLQVACALSRPVVGIFGPSNPRRNGPFGSRDKVAFHEMECSNCYKRKCPTIECLKKINPQEVAALSHQLLKENA
jgi:ADP-heptose:LPS heptosyltransferase